MEFIINEISSSRFYYLIFLILACSFAYCLIVSFFMNLHPFRLFILGKTLHKLSSGKKSIFYFIVVLKTFLHYARDLFILALLLFGFELLSIKLSYSIGAGVPHFKARGVLAIGILASLFVAKYFKIFFGDVGSFFRFSYRYWFCKLDLLMDVCKDLNLVKDGLAYNNLTRNEWCEEITTMKKDLLDIRKQDRIERTKNIMDALHNLRR